MAALSDVFLSPLGLLALLALVPLVLLYLIRPDPERMELPTLRFLSEGDKQEATNPIWERLQRSLLLLLQALAILLFAASLATPYVPVSERTTVEETVLVVDGSASMATQDGGATRFSRAVSVARADATGTTSVVFVGANSDVVLRRGSQGDARTALDRLAVTDAPGDLREGISTAAAVAGENARIVVLSDFADDSAWDDAVASARGREILVELRQFAGGGGDNVGIIDRQFSGREVTVSVKNFGSREARRTLSLGSQTRQLSLAPGDVATATFTVPAGGGRASLSPVDSFPTDDTLYLSAPPDARIDVLVLTNDENRFLTAALSVIDEVSLTVDTPPTAVDEEYDVIVYSNLQQERLLDGNVAAGRDTLEAGGGVAVQAQPDMPARYGDLLILEPGGLGQNPSIKTVRDDRMTRGINFPPPEEYVTGRLREGQPLVTLGDDTPLLATSTRGPGRILYYGYVQRTSAFKYNYQYPVFWKRAVFYLAGRAPLTDLNRETGGTLQFGAERRVQTPDGTVEAAQLPLAQSGYYAAGETRYGVSLLSEAESNVVSTPLEDRTDGVGETVREEERRVPNPLTPWVALALVGVVLAELAYLRRRGDL